MEHVFKPWKEGLNLDNLRWSGVAKVRMHVRHSVIPAVATTAHKMGRPDMANSIKTFAYQTRNQKQFFNTYAQGLNREWK